MSRVKKLEWTRRYPDHTKHPIDWAGRGVFGTLFVVNQYYPDGDFYVLGNGHKTLDEAQQHAQSYYDKCVLSALEPTNPPALSE